MSPTILMKGGKVAMVSTKVVEARLGTNNDGGIEVCPSRVCRSNMQILKQPRNKSIGISETRHGKVEING